jgi:photosystem II stability/assembly factor-like uncharacterized protein
MNWSVGAALFVVRFISGLLISTAMCCAQFQLSEPTVETDEESTTRESNAAVVLEVERVEAGESAADGPDSDDASDLINAPRQRVRMSGQPAGAGKSRVDRGVSKATGVTEEPQGVIQLLDSEEPRALLMAGGAPRTRDLLLDATLRDVACVGLRCWSVGDRGVICSSADGGETWETGCLPFECRLTSVCFLTNRIGWVAGVESQPGRKSGRAVLLATRDGGQTWRNIVEESGADGAAVDGVHRLPGIQQIQFFGLEEAIAITLPDTDRDNSTLFRSGDGGQSWTPVLSDRGAPLWTGGWFSSLGQGVIVGTHQGLGTLVSGESVVLQEPRATLRSFRSVVIDGEGRGWVAGDGATLLRTEDSGVSWAAPDHELPSGLADVLDVRCLAQRGEVMIASGDPGAMVLRTEDAGKSWQIIEADIRGQMHRMRALPDRGFLAVGSFGQIMKSEDDGLSWRTVRNVGIHCGILSLVTKLEQSPWALTSALTTDRGIRSVVLQPSVRLNEPREDAAGLCQTERALSALTLLGVSDVAGDWMFPGLLETQHRSGSSLMDEWDRRTDGRASELVPLRLARSIRSYRPQIVVIERCQDVDAIAELLRSAVMRGIELAGDATEPKLSGFGLPVWQVQRVLSRAPSDLQPTVVFRDTDLLPVLGTTSGLVCDAAGAVLMPTKATLPEASARRRNAGYELEMDLEQRSAITNPLDGLESLLTEKIRRRRVTRPRAELEELRQVLLRTRNEAGALQGHGAGLQATEAFVAELQDVGKTLPDALALRQLRELAELSQERNNAEGYLAVLQEIVRRFPETEDAWRAAESLLLFYGSAEARHVRLRGQVMPRGQQMGVVAGPFQDGSAGQSTIGSADGNGILSPTVQPAAARGFSGSATSTFDALHEGWNAQQETAWTVLSGHESVRVGRRNGPSAESRLRRAITLRGLGKNGEATSLLVEAAAGTDDTAAWAASELQILQGARSSHLRLLNVPRSVSRPILDGRLTDPVWENAEEIRLISVRGGTSLSSAAADESRTVAGNADDCLCLLAWDEQFLYLAARVPRGQTSHPVELAAARQHDEDHNGRDRVEICIDTDRDYLTAFQLVIDESGRTSDACWWLDRWNPQWYVAVDHDEAAWRLEAAIPLNELSSPVAAPGTLWSIRFQRILPGLIEQRLPGLSAASSLQGASLVRFIRPKATNR